MSRGFMGALSLGLAASLTLGAGLASAQMASPTGTGAPAPQISRGEQFMQWAAAASHTDPRTWRWPGAANADVRTSIIEGGYTPTELRNLYTVMLLQSGGRWLGEPAPPPFVPPSTQGAPRGFSGPPNAMAALMPSTGTMGNRGFSGLEQFYGSNGYLMDSVSERVNTVDYIIAKKDRVFMSWVIAAKHTGTLFGFPGDGKPLHIRESAFFTLNDAGQIIASDYRGDDLALYTQAGGKIEFPKK